MSEHLAIVTNAGDTTSSQVLALLNNTIPVGATILSAVVIVAGSSVVLGTDVTAAFLPPIQLPIITGLEINGTPDVPVSGQVALIQKAFVPSLAGATILVLYSTP